MYRYCVRRGDSARMRDMKPSFRTFSSKISALAGTAGVFILAISIVVIWALTGPIFNYSEKWQLVINTMTTIVTFLMVFLIQNTQNRDGKAIQLKLDELIRSNGGGTRQSFIDIEDISDDELEQLSREFRSLRAANNLHPSLHKLHIKVEEAHTTRIGRR